MNPLPGLIHDTAVGVELFQFEGYELLQVCPYCNQELECEGWRLSVWGLQAEVRA